MSSVLTPVNYVNAAFVSVASGTTAAITTVSGNLLVVVLTCFGNHIGVTPITDSNGNTWVLAEGPTGTTSGFVAIYYAMNIIGGAGHTFTFTPTTNDFIALSVFEIQGAKTSSALSSHNSSVASSTTHTSPSITANATVPEVFIGGGAVSHGAEGTPALNSTHWWLVDAVGGAVTEGIISAFRIVDPSTSDTFSFTVSSASNEGVAIAGFKAAAALGAGEHSATFFAN